ncbi:DUF3224 domain-containing protein [Streptomyces palmae]|uniref:DUF3224 domain-containing protein n=1 Tax=Streptomyces palmae TaxID=1701085 RepID=A0A4Z0HDC3_9ACTN|nr:DUF3224 domain-containing protein [Streptomyces palmae]TGB15607.1 DUF3224 domain-containing protein [Streptomyces palmae]
MTTTHATGTIAFADWQEQRVSEVAGGAALAHASVSNRYSGALEATGTSCQYTIVYLTEKVGLFSGYEQVEGVLDGRAGSFVLAHRGTFAEDGTVTGEYEVVPGSGSGELADLSGTGGFTAPSGQQDYPFHLDYRLG